MVLSMQMCFGKIEPKLTKYGRGCPVDTGVHPGPEPPQKFGYGPKFVGQLLSRNQVSCKTNQGEYKRHQNKCTQNSKLAG